VEITEEVAAENNLGAIRGLLIQRVIPDAPGQRAGLRDKDVIVKVDGRPTTTPDQLRALLRRHRPGDRLPLTVLRKGKSLEATVVLGEMPADLPVEPAETAQP